jgi:uncharacterized protein
MTSANGSSPLLLEVGNSRIPGLLVMPSPSCRRPETLVIVLHGLGARKEVQHPELQRLAAAGFAALAIDAPEHGDRPGPTLEMMARASSQEERGRLLFSLVDAAAREIPLLITHFRARGYLRIAALGISMGGHTAFATIRHEPRPDAIAPFIASPDWGARVGLAADDDPLFGWSPHLHLDRFSPTPVFAVTAGRDSTVPPEPCRRFMAALRPFYQSAPARLCHLDYPESEHMMRPEDWLDAWGRFTTWLPVALDL